MAESKQEDKQTLRVAILATDGFEEVEMTEPRKFLEESGRVRRRYDARSG